MNYPRIFTGIFIMALVTYIPRMVPLVFMKRKIENRFVKSFLQYVPYAVLAAMTEVNLLTGMLKVAPEKDQAAAKYIHKSEVRLIRNNNQGGGEPASDDGEK